MYAIVKGAKGCMLGMRVERHSEGMLKGRGGRGGGREGGS